MEETVINYQMILANSYRDIRSNVLMEIHT